VKLWLVRHAKPCIEPGICYGNSDVEADDQATRSAAATLAASLPRSIAVRVSPLRRCTQLAGALHRLRPAMHWQPDPRLAEMDFGSWEGRRWDEIGAPALDAWTRDFGQHRPGGAESVNAFMARVAAAFDEARAADRDAVWITHAGGIRAAMLLAGGTRTLDNAADWPQEAPGWGDWQQLTL
jgi:alpha-ribazole phosphatase